MFMVFSLTLAMDILDETIRLVCPTVWLEVCLAACQQLTARHKDWDLWQPARQACRQRLASGLKR
jgi:hypothetical protein